MGANQHTFSTEAERFWNKVRKQPDGCWVWTASIDTRGYGSYTEQGKHVLAHRYSYRMAVGDIPAHADLDHLCRVRPCVNPDHLEPVSRRENILRGTGFSARNNRKTHCPLGHEYSNVREGDRARRRCRTCDTISHHRRRTA